MKFKAVIFDLDGVIVSTDDYHYLAWKKIADQYEIPFDRETNEHLRGVSRMESLEIILKKSTRAFTSSEKEIMANEKNEIYKELLVQINPDDILIGVENVLQILKEQNVKTAIGSSSKNAPQILTRIGLMDAFDAIADGNDIQRSKPDPEVFLIAAEKLGVLPQECIVVEDAYAGIDAALAAGMKTIGVGFAAGYEKTQYKIQNLTEFNIDELEMLFQQP